MQLSNQTLKVECTLVEAECAKAETALEHAELEHVEAAVQLHWHTVLFLLAVSVMLRAGRADSISFDNVSSTANTASSMTQIMDAKNFRSWRKRGGKEN